VPAEEREESGGGTRELLLLAMAGDRAAVERLVEAWLPRAYGLCLRITRREDAAEEAVQETFVRALRALPSLRRVESFPSWLLAIAANTAREVVRNDRKAAGLEAPDELEAAAEPRGDARGEAIERALAMLDAEERELFLLHTVEGLSLDELARERRVSAAAMKSRVHRIRAKVRRSALRFLEREGDAS
jgi:RNA polymerase sigma-70 factor (ECF subfamily)